MLSLGGGLMVLGIIVWLVSLGIFENTLVVAVTLTVGSLLVHGAGCAVMLKTRYRNAGHALTFLGCILIPLNLWFYHAQGLVTLEGQLWVGGVLCSLIYIVTVVLTREPTFLYAVEGGITLTLVLLLGSQGVVTDATYLSLVLMGLALVSIHTERIFPPEAVVFDRKRFGLPLFWSGQTQLAAALATLVGSQILAIVLAPHSNLFGGLRTQWFSWTWDGNWLTQTWWLAGGIWLAGAYAYFYSDLIVRRAGLYTYLAAACLVGAEISFIADHLPAEVLIATPALTALLLSLLALRPGAEHESLQRNLRPLGLLLSGLSVLFGATMHVRATSDIASELGWTVTTGWPFVFTMLLVAACIRALAIVDQNRSEKFAVGHLLLSAASVLVAAAGLLRCFDIVSWSQQAPLLMIVPIGYLIAVRLWRGKQPEKPLALSAHLAALVIMACVFSGTAAQTQALIMPAPRAIENVLVGLVFAEAAVFYLLAAVVRPHQANIYAATAATSASVWQFAGHFGLPAVHYPVVYAGLGLALLAAARLIGYQQVRTFRAGSMESSGIVGRGAAAVHSASGLLLFAFLAGLLQALSRLVTEQTDWPLFIALGITVAVSLAAAVVAPTAIWRRIYIAWAVALGGVTLVTLNGLIELSVWQKTEIVAIVAGVGLLVAGYIGRFLEAERHENDGVTLALLLGSMLATSALLIATLYHRLDGRQVSLPDELGLVLVTVLMLVTGYSWQLKMPTLIGGLGLGTYLVVLLGMLAYFPNVAMGVYLGAGGAILFAAGLALSVYRERLLELPGKLTRREGLFTVLTWR